MAEQKTSLRLRALIRKETIQMLRDRRLLLFMLGLPVIELFLYGYAAALTVYHLPMAVVDQSNDAQSRALVQALVNSQYFDWTRQFASQADLTRAIDRGEVKAGVVIPPRFAASLERSSAEVLILLDGTDNAAVQSGYSAAALVAQDLALKLRAARVARQGGNAGAGSAVGITALPHVLYNPDSIDIWYILPALVGLVLQTLAVQQAAILVVRERELGTLEGTLGTPVRPLELVVSKLVPLLALCLAALGTILLIGVFWFGVPFRGSLLLYLWLALLFIASSLGLGLLLSTRAANQIQATQYGLLFMIFGTLLSGFIYPTSAMPLVPRLVGSMLPLSYFIRISRGVFTRGVGLSFVWSDALVLLVYGVVVVVIAARSFKPRLD